MALGGPYGLFSAAVPGQAFTSLERRSSHGLFHTVRWYKLFKESYNNPYAFVPETGKRAERLPSILADKKGKIKDLRQIAALAVTFRQEHSFFPDS